MFLVLKYAVVVVVRSVDLAVVVVKATTNTREISGTLAFIVGMVVVDVNAAVAAANKNGVVIILFFEATTTNNKNEKKTCFLLIVCPFQNNNVC